MNKPGLLSLIFGLMALTASATAGSAMVRIPGGSYLPFYTLGAARKPVNVPPYSLDVYPVTNADYLNFVRTWPQWRRSRVKPIFADKQYLALWRDDVSFDAALARSPVVQVSWFAAQAYCKAQGKHLPTVDQWEFAGLADETRKDASKDLAFSRRILGWYGRPTQSRLPAVGRFRNLYGIYDLHGLVWEWTRDFNSIMITGESREDAGGINRDLYCAGGSTAGASPGDYASYMRFAFRSSLEAHYTVQNLGFRCAKE